MCCEKIALDYIDNFSSSAALPSLLCVWGNHPQLLACSCLYQRSGYTSSLCENICNVPLLCIEVLRVFCTCNATLKSKWSVQVNSNLQKCSWVHLHPRAHSLTDEFDSSGCWALRIAGVGIRKPNRELKFEFDRFIKEQKLFLCGPFSAWYYLSSRGMCISGEVLVRYTLGC